MKIFFAVLSAEWLRFYDSTIELLAERGHSVAVTVNRLPRQKMARLEGLGTAAGRITLAGKIPPRGDAWEPLATAIRGTIDYVRYLDPRFADARFLRERAERKGLPMILRPLTRAPTLTSSQVRALVGFLVACERAIPSSKTVEQLLRSQRFDLVLVSPLVNTASEQVDVIKSAKALGIPTGLCVASWDNLTNKGHVKVPPDAVFVWNEDQKVEAIILHSIPAERVAITGAQVFDRWFGRPPSRTREAFCRTVGLPADRPMVLYVGGTKYARAPEAEARFARTWIEAIRRSDNPAVREAGVLVRPHPYNTAPWQTADFSDLGAVAVWPRDGANIMDQDDRADYFDSMYHSAAVVGINTSAMIEAAIVDRPVHTILVPELSDTQVRTVHFDYLRPENGGFLQIAANLDEHVAQLAESLAGAGGAHAANRAFVQAFIRPRGIDSPANPILVDAIEQLGHQGRQRAERLPLGLLLLRALLWLAVTGTSWTRSGKTVAGRSPAKRLRSRLRRLRRAVGKVAKRQRRRVRRRWVQTIRTWSRNGKRSRTRARVN